MRAFSCGNCRQLVWFDNTACLRCGTELGYLPEKRELVPLPVGYRRCANAELAACNWLVDEASGDPLCAACELTRTRPRDDDADALVAFAAAESAKRRLLFQLDELKLPVRRLDEQTREGLAFDLLSSKDQPVTTGHANGVITLDLAEGDDARREQRRQQLGEPYRTLLG